MLPTASPPQPACDAFAAVTFSPTGCEHKPPPLALGACREPLDGVGISPQASGALAKGQRALAGHWVTEAGALYEGWHAKEEEKSISSTVQLAVAYGNA